ncbi:MAG: hypothetical protein JJ900_04395 [Rhodospirillales bacterium]|nr:hypothetical protein [Rhodospirillales bacterium]MBO6786069.1 hypothetical protein [Rhodospirillales bacterium]
MATQPTRTTESSWTITGASAETREKVKKAAAAEGMTIRAWVDKTLNAAADGKLSAGPASTVPKELAEMQAKLDDLLKRMPEDPKAAEKAASERTSAAVLKAVAAGLGEMQRSAKEQARIAEGKPAKKKTKASKAPARRTAGRG